MENYKKGKNVEEELTQDRIPIESLPENFLWMHVKGGTKVPNVVEFAEKAFNSGEQRSVVWSGSGGGVPKTISCAEIMKRNYDVHQVTRLSYQKIEEYWDPVLQGLDQIIVTRQIPAIHIFLSLDEINPKTPGYQKANTSSFWPEPAHKQQNRDDDYVYKDKRNVSGQNVKTNSQNRNRIGNTNGRPQNNQSSGSGANKPRNQNNKPRKSESEPGTSTKIRAEAATS